MLEKEKITCGLVTGGETACGVKLRENGSPTLKIN